MLNVIRKLLRKLTLKRRLQKIKLVAIDVDGTLTDGRIIRDGEGKEYLIFYTKDGTGIKLAQEAGIPVVFITGRSSPVSIQRARELEVEIFFGRLKKVDTLKEIEEKYGVKGEEIMYIGDDIIDYEIMGSVGITVAVGDADPKIKEIADIVTKKPGGRGAVREALEILLKAKKSWKKATKRYTKYIDYIPILLIVSILSLNACDTNDDYVLLSKSEFSLSEMNEAQQNIPFFVMEDFKYHASAYYTGETEWVLESSEATTFYDSPYIYLKDIKAWFYEKNSTNLNYFVKADLGIIDRKQGIVIVRGKVIGKGIKTGTLVITSELTWDHSAQKLYNDKPTTLIKDNTKIEGIGLEAYPQTGEVILKEVKGSAEKLQ